MSQPLSSPSGERIQTRAEDQGVGVHDPAWRETKVACCLTLTSQRRAKDPQPEPPKKFLDPVEVKRLAAEVHSRGRAASARSSPSPETPRKRRKRKRGSPERQRREGFFCSVQVRSTGVRADHDKVSESVLFGAFFRWWG